MSPISIAGYLALFFGFGIFFLFIHLLMGRFLRPKAPSVEKLQVYECGEPAIGSSFVQFDLRFYVVALLFIIFDVEVAFFFPWGVVFGKATQLMDPNVQLVVSTPADAKDVEKKAKRALSPDVVGVFDALAVPRASQPTVDQAATVPELRDHVGTVVDRRHPGFLCGAAGGFCVCVAARRPGLGAGHEPRARLVRLRRHRL